VSSVAAKARPERYETRILNCHLVVRESTGPADESGR
jgi:hypothetical protein